MGATMMSESSFTRIHEQIARRKAELKEQGKLGRREWNLIEKRAVAHLEKMAKLGHRPVASRMGMFEVAFTWTDDGGMRSVVGDRMTVVLADEFGMIFGDGLEERLVEVLTK